MTLREELDELDRKATQGEWRYRPDKHDDWGVVRSPPEGDMGRSYVLAQFRDPDNLSQDILARHREAGTDPWVGNARFVTALVNAYRTSQLVPLPEVEELAKVLAWARGKRFLSGTEDVDQIKEVFFTPADEEDATAIINHMKGKTDG